MGPVVLQALQARPRRPGRHRGRRRRGGPDARVRAGHAHAVARPLLRQAARGRVRGRRRQEAARVQGHEPRHALHGQGRRRQLPGHRHQVRVRHGPDPVVGRLEELHVRRVGREEAPQGLDEAHVRHGRQQATDVLPHHILLRPGTLGIRVHVLLVRCLQPRPLPRNRRPDQPGGVRPEERRRLPRPRLQRPGRAVDPEAARRARRRRRRAREARADEGQVGGQPRVLQERRRQRAHLRAVRRRTRRPRRSLPRQAARAPRLVPADALHLHARRRQGRVRPGDRGRLRWPPSKVDDPLARVPRRQPGGHRSLRLDQRRPRPVLAVHRILQLLRHKHALHAAYPWRQVPTRRLARGRPLRRRKDDGD
mmetsp:Transcript_15764/g.50552  ORF Transcript_15764/g.50552 Transcript_15764/m.50552 type:complete len:366 (-) Transcript_15764:704-1801(-)